MAIPIENHMTYGYSMAIWISTGGVDICIYICIYIYLMDIIGDYIDVMV